MSDKVKPLSSQEELNSMIEIYWANVTRQKSNFSLEFESKFGTRGIKPITRIDYDNVIKQLLSQGFSIKYENNYLFQNLKQCLFQIIQ